MFTDAGAARTVISQIKAGPGDGHNAHRMEALAQNYQMRGNPPMERSPIPPAPSAEGQFDPEFAAAGADCAPGKPCCMTAGALWDANDSGRKLVWPVDKKKPLTNIGTSRAGETMTFGMTNHRQT